MSGWDGLDEFLAVAETGGFSKAAERLRLSTSQVSRAVAQLEERLQARLFFRTTRRVSLTETGQILLTHCQRLQEEREEAFQAIGDVQGSPKGMLRVTCSVAYGEQFVMPLLNDFLEQHPQVHLEMELTNRTVDLVHERFDLAIRLGRLGDSAMVARQIAPRRMFLVAAPAYLEQRGTPHSLSELAAHRCLIGTSETWVFSNNGADWLFRPRHHWRCNSGHAVLDATLRGFGLAQLPDYYVRDPLRSGRLVSLLPEQQPPGQGVWALYPQRRYLSSKVRLVVDHLRAGLARRPEYQGPETQTAQGEGPPAPSAR